MAKLNYKYCLVKPDTKEVFLFNKSEMTGNHKTDHFLTDVEVDIESRGLLNINGLEHEWHHTQTRIDIDTLEHKVRNSDIKENKPNWFTKLFGDKHYKYVIGTYAFPAKNKVSFIISDYIIKIMD